MSEQRTEYVVTKDRKEAAAMVARLLEKLRPELIELVLSGEPFQAEIHAKPGDAIRARVTKHFAV